MKKSVFISSTYVDLLEHRKSIWNLLSKYDVTVKGMEAFGARKEAPIDTCLNEVSQSDIYIGIIAHRLGSIEKNSGKSMTQLEYERALEENKEILIYIINDNDSVVFIEHVDFDEKRTKLLNFKTILKERHTIDTFKDKQDLSSKIEARLDDLLTKETRDDSNWDNCDYSKEILERFHLLPRVYSGEEILLSIKLNNNAYPISKELCDRFGYEYGKTISVPIEISKPKINNNELKEIIIEEDLVDVYYSKMGQSINVKAKLLFSIWKIETSRADFFDRTYKTYEENPNYDSSRPSLSGFSEYTTIEYMNNSKYLSRTKTIKGEGKAILELKEIISN